MKTQTTNNQLYCPQAAVRYARVLYELGISKEALAKAREIFTEVPQLHDVFINPTIREEQKIKVIDEVFPTEIRKFLKITCRYKKMNLVEDIFAAYDRYSDAQNQILSAELICTEPPSEVQLKEMQAFLCNKYKASKADIDVKTDNALLGGFVLRAGNDEYDWSIKGRLNRLEQKLTWR